MIYFYTITSPEQLNLCENLKKSLLRFGHYLEILPLYEKNNFSKLKINSVLQENTYKDNDFIVICDGFDVVCAKNPEPSIENYFKKEEGAVDILFSSENMFGNNMVFIKEYYDKYNALHGTSGKYLNSGVIIGRANKLKQFYQNLSHEIDTLKQYLPPDRRDSTGDQTYIINYLYHIDFMNKKDMKIKIDLKDDLIFTNTIVDRDYNVTDYVFIHTWGIYIPDPHYKYIRDQQYKKWSDINQLLNL